MNTDLYTIFTKSNIKFLFCFLAIYILLSFIIQIIVNKELTGKNELYTSRIFDIFVFIIIIIIFINKILYNNFTFFDKDNLQYLDEPISLVAALIHIFIFYTMIYLIGISMNPDTKSIAISLYEFFSWLIILIVSIFLFFKYFFNIIITDEVNNLWGIIPDIPKPVIYGNISGNISANVATVKSNEVFNISNNLYTYDDAKSICTSYNARLATYDDIEKSYNDGGEWCNYGWSEGQMAFFPTQKDTWQKLQKNPKTKNNCGRPGINGGYIDNPYIKFGVNCYGVKPKATAKDIERMNAINNQINPTTNDEKNLDSKVEFWKKNGDKMLNINSFNTKKWSEY